MARNLLFCAADSILDGILCPRLVDGSNATYATLPSITTVHFNLIAYIRWEDNEAWVVFVKLFSLSPRAGVAQIPHTIIRRPRVFR